LLADLHADSSHCSEAEAIIKRKFNRGWNAAMKKLQVVYGRKEEG